MLMRIKSVNTDASCEVTVFRPLVLGILLNTLSQALGSCNCLRSVVNGGEIVQNHSKFMAPPPKTTTQTHHSHQSADKTICSVGIYCWGKQLRLSHEHSRSLNPYNYSVGFARISCQKKSLRYVRKIVTCILRLLRITMSYLMEEITYMRRRYYIICDAQS